MNAVITADIVDYTSLSQEDAKKVFNTIDKLFLDRREVRTNLEGVFSVKRGDSVQAELIYPELALKEALLLKTAVNTISLGKSTKRSPDVDLRIAIGIGAIQAKWLKVNESSGDAYIHSGRLLDSMKSKKRSFAIKTDSLELDNELEPSFKLLEMVMSNWTKSTAETLYWTLLDESENNIAQRLGITQPAINQNKKKAGWNAIESLLARFEYLILK